MPGPDMSKFDVKSIMSSMRKVIDPEYGVPTDEATHPVNYRIVRLSKLVKEVAEKQRHLSLELEKVETNLKALLEELNKNIDHVEPPKEEGGGKSPEKSEQSDAAKAKDEGDSAKHDVSNESDTKEVDVVEKPEDHQEDDKK